MFWPGGTAAAGAPKGCGHPNGDAFEAEGLPGLVAKKRGPQAAYKLTEEVVAFVGELRSEDPSVSATALAERVFERFGKRIHPRSIERALVGAKKKRPSTKTGGGH